MKNIEQELKLVLDERQYGILCDIANVAPVLQTNYYFYGMSLATEMVRLRLKEEKWTFCYKKRLALQNGISVCDERETEITEFHAQNMISRGVTSVETRKLLGVESGPLKYIGNMQTYRTRFVLEEWTLEADKNIYLGRTDYELECENTDADSLERLKSYLLYTFGIDAIPSLPKIERFVQALK